MSMLAWVVVITFIAGGVGTGLGGVVGAIFKRDNTKTVSLLLALAGGVMLAIVCFDLVPSAIAPSESEPANIFVVIGGTLAGFFIVYLLNILIDHATNKEVRHIDEDHPKTADNLDELIHSDHYAHHANEPVVNKKQLFAAGIVMGLAIALHNLPEGMVIGAAIANGGIATGGTAITLAIIIGLHNIPEGMAVAVPLITGGSSRLKAIIITFLSGLPTVIGALLGYWLGTLGDIWLTIALSFASGAMLYVVFGELLPAAYLMWKSKFPAVTMLAGVMLGLIIIYV